MRMAEFADWREIWRIVEPVFRAGETYAFAPDIAESEAMETWFEKPAATWLAINVQQEIVGTYFIKPNQPGLGNHVCNCGYIVSESARGRGIASEMCVHSQQQAVEMGFRAMQYNFVVSTNEGAIRLWKRLGFDVVGTLPGAFRHSRLGFVDALVMFKSLV